MSPLQKTDFVLHTERLLLRPLQLEDAEMLWPHVSDPEIPQYMSWRTHENIAMTREFLQDSKQNFQRLTGICWVIFQKEQFCGVISLDDIQKSVQATIVNAAELGYWIAKEFWGQGIATEAAQAVLQFAFDRFGLHKVTIRHFIENIRSERVIQKLGFRLIGVKKEDVFKGGKWYDNKIYELLAREFFAITEIS